MTGEPLLLKPQDAFQRIGIGRDAGYSLIREGRLRAVRIGETRWLIPVTELSAFIERELGGDGVGRAPPSTPTPAA